MVLISFILLLFTKSVEIKPETEEKSYFIHIKETFQGVPENKRGLVILLLTSEFFTTFGI